MRHSVAIKRVRFLVFVAICAAALSCKGKKEGGAIERSANAVLAGNEVPVPMVGDTYVASGQSNRNYGYDVDLKVTNSGSNRTILQVDPAAVEAAIAGRTVVSARIDATLTAATTGFGSSGSIAVHRLAKQISERFATWSCATDAHPLNSSTDCTGSDVWNMSTGSNAWNTTATSTKPITNGMTGVVSFDVSADIAALRAGSIPGNGWVLKVGTAAGTAQFGSRETSTPPVLVITVSGDDAGTPPEPGPESEVAVISDGEDTYVRDGQPNQNKDGELTTEIRVQGNSSVLIRFDEADVLAAAAAHPSARFILEFTIAENFNNWGDGRPVGIHRIKQDWAAADVTWNCAHDSNIANGNPNCSGADAWTLWNSNSTSAFAWDIVATDVEIIQNGQGGKIYFDVTSDVHKFATGTGDFGWMVRNEEPSSEGHASLSSMETSSAPVIRVLARDECVELSSSDTSCDGIDDDCDGQLDEDFVEEATICGVGGCASVGATSCVNGAVANSCVAGLPAADDTSCNGVDDDCDGVADEDYVAHDTSCGVGACAATGAASCVSGVEVDSCEAGTPAASDETCNGVDDDCNGAVDDGYAAHSTMCGVGACAASGTTSCANGTETDSCEPGTPAFGDGTCDGADDDCDGIADEDYVSHGTTCGLGACVSTGTAVCQGGIVVDSCVAGTPTSSTDGCGGIDNDCDGQTDEDCCVPATCAMLGANCGSVSDGCGGTLVCGTCESPETCGGAGVANACGAVSLPPDPATVAPPLPAAGDSRLYDLLGFLFQGTEPGQYNVTADTFDPQRIAAVHGRVLDENRDPLPGVKIFILHHPEYGFVHSRADGEYDIAVNGGETMVVAYEHHGVLPVQRRFTSRWESYSRIDDVVMIPQSPVVSPVTMGAPTSTWAISATETDNDGSRQVAALFPPGTHAYANVGSATLPLDELHVRFTEYTVGDGGVQRMPADLPPDTFYTFAMEAAVDEVGSEVSVQFDRTVPIYVDNFLNFEPGTHVPSGYYDTATAQWVAIEDGRVVEIVSVTDGKADLNVTYPDHDADDSTELFTALGITDDERQRLAERYAVGTTLWRMPVEHFSKLDFNLMGNKRVKPDDKQKPKSRPTSPEDGQVCATGSIIRCQSRDLGEMVPVSGSGFNLQYDSNRVEANQSSERSFKIPVGTPGPYQTGWQLRIIMFGRTVVDVPLSRDELFYTFVWDGKDPFGRTWNGAAPFEYYLDATIEPEYLEVVAQNVGQREKTFGGLGPKCYANDPCCVLGTPAVGGQGVLTRPAYRYINGVKQTFMVSSTGTPGIIGDFQNENLSLGGWGLDIYHSYAPLTGDLWLGTGEHIMPSVQRRQASIAAGAASDAIGTNDPASSDAAHSDITYPAILGVDPVGRLYFVARGTSIARGGRELWVIDEDQNVKRLTLSFPTSATDIVDTDVAGDGVVYIVTQNPVRRLWRMERQPNNVWQGTLVVDGAYRVAVVPDGTVYYVVLVGSEYRIMQLRQDGTPTLVYKTTSSIQDMDVSENGRLAFAVSSRIYEVMPSGGLQLLAGGGTKRTDGTLPTEFDFNTILQFDIAPDGTLYVTDVAGSSFFSYRFGPDGASALLRLPVPESPIYAVNPIFLPIPSSGHPAYIAVAPDGKLYVAEQALHRILRVNDQLGRWDGGSFLVPAPNGREAYIFDGNGHHLATRDATTGKLVWSFAHDGQGRLVAVADADGRVTTISRPSASALTFEAPAGPGPTGATVTTNVALDADGYIDTVSDAKGNTWAFDYQSGGLLSRRWDPTGNANGLRQGTPYEMTYETFGFVGEALRHYLAMDRNAVGGTQTLKYGTATADVAPTSDYDKVNQAWCDGSLYVIGWKLVEENTTTARVTGMDRATVHATQKKYENNKKVERVTVTSSAGRTTERVTNKADATEVITEPGSTLTITKSPDPRFGVDAAFVSKAVTAVAAVSGRTALTNTQTATRSVTLQNPLNPLSVTSFTETTAQNGTRTSSVTYNASNLTYTTVSPAGRTTYTQLDNAGRVVAMGAPGRVPTTYEYDGGGYLQEVRQVRGGEARSTRYGYDDRGYLAAVTADVSVGESLQTLLTNDVLGFPESASVPGIGALTQTSNEMGQTSSLTPPGKPTHGMSYSAIGELTQYTPPLASPTAPPGQCPVGAECYNYNLDRQLEDIQLGSGAVVDYTYHATRGLLTSVNVPGSGTSSFAYTTVGRLQSITAPDNGVITYTTQGDLPIREAWSGTHQVKDGATTIWSGTLNGTVDRTYNAFLELERLAVTSGFDQRLVRDADGLVTRIEPWASGSGVPNFVINRSALDGSVTDTALGTVTTAVLSDLSTATPGYGDLTGLTADVAGNRVFETEYERDLLGRITQIHETVDGDERTRRYEYDAAGRLITVRNESSTVLATYAYDANGNRTLAHTPSGDVDLGVNLGCLDGSAADEEDRLCRYGDFEYGYDGNGAMNVRTRISTGASEQFTYDGLGRLTKAVVPGKTIHYVLDGQGRRMGKVVNGALQKGWVYGGALTPIAQLNAAGAVESTFVYGTRPNVPDYIVTTGGTVYRVIADHLGSVRLVVNASTGAIVQRMDYDEWGNVTYESGNTTLHPFGYAGGLYDRDTGLVRFGARDYDPVTGRWTAKDPVKFGGGNGNLYGYVANDPLNYWDPVGKWPLPADPSGLGSEWRIDTTFKTKNPNSKRYVDTNGNTLRFDKGDPSLPKGRRKKWKRIDHWHFNGGKEHLLPGTDIPELDPVCSEGGQSFYSPDVPEWTPVPDGPPTPIPFMPMPTPMPVLPIPTFAPTPIPAFL